MTAKSNFLENKIIDHIWRGQPYTAPNNIFFSLIRATAGISPRSMAVTLGQTTVPFSPNGRMYRCSTAGTTGASEPAWSTVENGTTADGTAVWTEMTTDFESYSAIVSSAEVSGGSYARVSVAASLANFSGTQGPGTTTASTGANGTTSNNVTITWGSPTSNWGVIGAVYTMDAITAGNPLTFGTLTVPKTINNGDAAPSYPVAAFTYQEDN